MSKTRSLRRQLLVMTFIVLLFISSLALWGAHIYANRTTKISYDRLLYGAALQMAENITLVNGKVIIDLPISAFETLSLSSSDRAFYSIMNTQYQVLTGYKDLPDIPFPQLIRESQQNQPIKPLYYESNYRGERVRFIILSKRLLEADKSKTVFVIVGQSMEARAKAAKEFNQIALQFVSVFFIITMLLLLFVIWQVLRPLQSIKQAITERSSLDLSALDIHVPSEIAPLVGSINYFMAQLDNTLQRLERFTAESAHQIRTPLAGLISQAQNALDEKDAALRKQQLENILESSQLLTQTVNQLLNRATLTHRFQSHPFSLLSLDELIKDTCRELVVWALEKHVEIAYVGDAKTNILGDEFALKQMLHNIIENAVKYSPEHGTVEVELMTQSTASNQALSNQATLQIRDQGVGVCDEDKLHIFEYFYRSADNVAAGSGIGLSIAKEVAEHHKAAFHLKDNQPTGLIVEIVFLCVEESKQ
ncbi:Swarming motility regulation sensor protein RssA [Marinomonas spartinae]|uniref:sensor histidine kinase n=1 Tax=Marinomonas spartinae TaxID=1792290 RepID=UPI0008090EEA|nr:sensor histidine kinase [Marinomonas spartinae]SBS30400.1 Swarming motility regulation sensor protein RssA [Marinomonas spartinae]